MGWNVQTGTTTSKVANPDVDATLSKIAKGIGAEYTPGKSAYTAPGANTIGGQSNSLAAALNPNYSSSLAAAIGDFGDVAAGNRFGTNDPGYAALRAKLASDVTGQVNTSFNNSNLFGSDSNIRELTGSLTDALAGLDYGNYQSDIARQERAAATMPQLFSAAQLPGSVQQSVGASQDADAAAKQNGTLDYLAKISSIANGGAAAAGTTSYKDIPLWQLLLGGASTIAGAL